MFSRRVQFWDGVNKKIIINRQREQTRPNVKSDDARRFLSAVPQSDWKRPTGRPHISWLATMKNDLSSHNLSVEDATELALDRPLWRLLAASGAMHWNGASWTMMMMIDECKYFCYRYTFLSMPHLGIRYALTATYSNILSQANYWLFLPSGKKLVF